MIFMRSVWQRLATVTSAHLCLVAFASQAQVGGASSAAGMNAAMMKLFNVPAFTAKAFVLVKDGTGKELMTTLMDFSLLEGKVRVDIDLMQMNNKEMPAGAAANYQRFGMAKVTSIIRPDQKCVYIIYPQRKAYINMPFTKEDADAVTNPPKIARTVIGKETVEGHPCTKQKVVITDGSGKTTEAVVWVASDMKEFPIQIQTTEKGNTSVVTFRQIQYNRPDAKSFDPPAGYTKYADSRELMQSVMLEVNKRPPGQTQGTTAPAPAAKSNGGAKQPPGTAPRK